LLVAAALLLAACSRSGTLSGDVVVQVPAGPENPVARLRIRAVAATEAFEQDWAAALRTFQEELEPARRARQEAAASLDRAKLAWDRALGASRGRQRDFRMAQARNLWRQVLAGQQRVFAAQRREREVALRHNRRAVALLERYTMQEVQTDGTGHYVMAGLSTGPAYLYARLTVGQRSLVWLHRVQVRAGAQQVDLTEENSTRWPFSP
jgi:hypothetical protein